MIICIHSQQQVNINKGGSKIMLDKIVENRKKQGEHFFPVKDLTNKKQNKKKKQKKQK